YVEAAMGSDNLAAAMTQRLLTIACRQSINDTAVDVNCMVLSIEELLRGTVGAHAQLQIELDEGVSVVRTDENQLENAM
ncbi:PAS domain-containing sensor histidine kinase, partial [Pseudomonas syringae pv. tagetis]